MNISENQVDMLKDAIQLNKAVTLCGIKGDHVLLLRPAQISRLEKVSGKERCANSYEC